METQREKSRGNRKTKKKNEKVIEKGYGEKDGKRQ